jgi:hypothetical protein
MLKQKIIFVLVALFFIVLAGKGEAFVPQTPHLLHLVIQKIKQPAGMVVHQIRNVGAVSGREAMSEIKPGTNLETNLEAKTVQVDEKLRYLLPGKLRSDIVSGKVSRFYVESESQFIKVADGMIVSLKKSPVDFYTDPLLYRDHETLMTQLVLAGVDTQQVTFQRFEDKICYFIGQPPVNGLESPGLWIEKTSLFPVRYVGDQEGWRVSFHYENWHRVSQTWYPLRTTIFMDNQVFATIDVQQFELESGFSSVLFDVTHIQGKYPDGSRSREEGQESPDRFDELDKQIDDFRKLYE